MKLKITISLEIEVTPENLKSYYDASTIEEAATNQQKWIDDGSCDLMELIDFYDNVVTVEPIK